jgi:hypothetical protein
MIAEFVYDGSYWQIQNYLGTTSGATTNNYNSTNLPYALDTSTSSNTITVSPTPALPSSVSAGQALIVKLANPITGATTIGITGVSGSPFPVISFTGQPLGFGAASAGEMLWMLFDGANFQIINPPQPLQANLTIYVNSSIGSDSYDGSQPTVSGTKGPLQHIQTAVNKAFNYPPAPAFSVTIQCADGTYNESVYTPTSPGPSIIVNGHAGAPSNVVVQGPNNIHVFAVGGPNTMTVQNLKVITGTGLGPPCCFVAQGSGATMYTNNTINGFCAYAVHEAYGPCFVVINNHTYAGNATYAMNAAFSGFVGLGQNAVYSIPGSISVSAWANAIAGGSIEVPTSPYTPSFVSPGNVTGSKYQATLNGTILSQGQGPNFFPGTTAGTTGTGGQYN